MAFRLPKKDKKAAAGEFITALDIGTEFVKVLVARVNGEELEIVGVGRKHQDIGDMHSGAIADIDSVVRNCEEALAEAEAQAEMQAKRVIVGIAGELVKGTTSTIRYRRPQPNKPLDEDEMEFIIEKVQERAQEKAQKQVAIETGNAEVEVKLVNAALVGIHIDGYKVSNPIGFQGKDVAVQIYTAYAPMVHIGAIERVCDKLALDLLAVAAEPFAVSRSVIGNDVSSNFTAILADVGGGTTDIAVIDDGGVEGTKMFGIGGRSFTRQIAAGMSVSYEVAEKIKLGLDEDELSGEKREAAEKAVERTLGVWMGGVALALEEFTGVDHLPGKILLCGGGASLTALQDALLDTDWWKELPFTHRPKVQLISLDDVVGIRNTTKVELNHTFITAMGLLRVGFDTMMSIGDSGSLVEKISNMLRA
ncbi:rod shape-determining protein [Candidatus Saccharibacteria bacterium]|nr:rod shape-determining protein [Candidatus Saccharibacteria bacterium]